MQLSQRAVHRLYYGWVIVAVAFAVFVVMGGVWSSFAVFYVALVEEFGWSRAATAGAFSVYMVVLGLTSPVAGWLADRLGPRRLMPAGAVILALGLAGASRLSEPWHLYLAYGVVVAFGQNCVGFIPHLKLIANWFHRRRGAAFGIATAGTGLGSVACLPAVQFLILQFGWRTAFLALGSVVLLLAPLTGLMHRTQPGDLGLWPDGMTAGDAGEGESRHSASAGPRWRGPFAEASVGKALSSANFWAMNTSNFFFGMATIVFVFQVAHIVAVGFTPMLAATVSGLVGLLVALGRILGGVFSDRLGKPATGIFGVLLLAIGVMALFLGGAVQSPWLLFVYGLLFGLGWGFFGIVGSAITADLFQGRSYGAVAGILEIGTGVGGFVGPWLGGYLFDQLGSYTAPFIIAVVSSLVGGALFRLAYRGTRAGLETADSRR